MLIDSAVFGIRGDAATRSAGGYAVDPETGCWVWMRSRCGGGRKYGKFKGDDGLQTLAHIYSWTSKNGPVPNGMNLDHFVCDNTLCCNPDHIRPTTPRENVLRSSSPAAMNLAKTHCPRKHPYDEENTYVDRTGRRHCRACRRRSSC